jgi:aspartate-semialdehyde dehydrogenase
MKEWKLLLIGGGSLHVQEILNRLKERNLPVSKIQLLAEGDRVGALHDFKNEPLLVGKLDDLPEEGYDAAVLLSPISDIEKITTILVSGSIPLLDASGSIHPTKTVPIIFSEYWCLEKPVLPRVSVLPSPITLALGLICKPILESYGISQVTVQILQGSSALGSRQGMDELFEQTRSLLGFKPLELNEFPKQIAFNAFPVDNVRELQQRVNVELNAFLGLEHMQFNLDVIWGSIFVGMLGTVWIDTIKPVKLTNLTKLLSSIPSVKCTSDTYNPGVLDIVGKDHVEIGGVRIKQGRDHGLTLRIALDNLRKGLSTNVIQTLELFTQKD